MQIQYVKRRILQCSVIYARTGANRKKEYGIFSLSNISVVCSLNIALRIVMVLLQVRETVKPNTEGGKKKMKKNPGYLSVFAVLCYDRLNSNGISERREEL